MIPGGPTNKREVIYQSELKEWNALGESENQSLVMESEVEVHKFFTLNIQMNMKKTENNAEEGSDSIYSVFSFPPDYNISWTSISGFSFRSWK